MPVRAAELPAAFRAPAAPSSASKISFTCEAISDPPLHGENGYYLALPGRIRYDSSDWKQRSDRTWPGT